MKNSIKIIKKVLSYILIYWFALTFIPDMVNNTNQIIDFLIVSVFFTILMHIVPFIIEFFKLSKKNQILKSVLVFILTFGLTFAMKPGITGILYFPSEISLNENYFFLSNLDEFGIILFISILATILFLIFDFKEK